MARPQKSPYPKELYQSQIYYSWLNLRRRCDESTNNRYYRYGARGITYPKKWHSFSGFLNDMQVDYQEGLQLDRIDNNKSYSKINCRWVTPKENSNNRSNNRVIIYKGIKKTLAQWSEYTGLNRTTIAERINRGWNVDKALTTSLKGGVK